MMPQQRERAVAAVQESRADMMRIATRLEAVERHLPPGTVRTSLATVVRDLRHFHQVLGSAVPEIQRGGAREPAPDSHLEAAHEERTAGSEML